MSLRGMNVAITFTLFSLRFDMSYLRIASTVFAGVPVGGGT